MKIKHLLSFISLTSLLLAAPVSAEESAKRPDDTFKKAMTYFYQKKFEMAELMLQEELKLHPENQLAYSYLGDIFLNKKRYDGALELYHKALDINPDSAEDYFRLGQVYYYKKQATPAIENFQKSFRLNQSIKFAYYHIGLAYLMLERDKQHTIENWENYLKIAPEDPQYEKIRRAIELLKDPDFVLPPPGSDISVEEALHLGGIVLKDADRKAEDKKAGHEDKKTKNKLEDIYRDDGL